MTFLLWTILFLPVFLFLAGYIMTNPTAEEYDENIYIPVDKLKLYEHVSHLTSLEKPRNYTNVDALNSAADYIRKKFERSGGQVLVQEYQFSDNIYKNVICSFGPTKANRIIIGAHYDVCDNQPGADDNASGVAGILELARLLGEESPELQYRVDLVAYTLEEPPFFRTGQMGSDVHAKSLSDADITIKEMISLEMIGYFSDEENSQNYPFNPLKFLYPSTGNYIMAVGNVVNFPLVQRCKNWMTQASRVEVFSINAPSLIPGIDLSDHRSYWKYGFPAMMITDTAFYRNPNYHKPTDTIETLHFERMAEVVKGVYWYLVNRAKMPPPKPKAADKKEKAKTSS